MWAVTLTFDVDADLETLDSWENTLSARDASVSRVPGQGVMVIGYESGDAPLEAARAFCDAATQVLHAQPLTIEIAPEAVHVHRSEEPTLPQVVSAPEVGELLGVSRQRVHQLRSAAAFPAPLYELRAGPIWDVRAVEHFAATWERKPGRRSRATA